MTQALVQRSCASSMISHRKVHTKRYEQYGGGIYMSIRYTCRCCGMKIAEFDETQVTEAQLGFDSLTPEERALIISREQSGDTVVSITCDYCREALNHNPELSLVGSPLQ